MENKPTGKRIFILIDKTDSAFLDKIEAAIRQAEAEKRAARLDLRHLKADNEEEPTA